MHRLYSTQEERKHGQLLLPSVLFYFSTQNKDQEHSMLLHSSELNGPHFEKKQSERWIKGLQRGSRLDSGQTKSAAVFPKNDVSLYLNTTSFPPEQVQKRAGVSGFRWK